MNEDEIFGLVERFVFQNHETGFGILILKTKEKLPVTLTGNFINIHEGQELYVKGNWCYNQKFGKQFQVTSYFSKLPNNISGLKKYLGSGLIKGIGKTLSIISKNTHSLSLILRHIACQKFLV